MFSFLYHTRIYYNCTKVSSRSWETLKDIRKLLDLTFLFVNFIQKLHSKCTDNKNSFNRFVFSYTMNKIVVLLFIQ